MNERQTRLVTPVDGIMVMMTWHCAICKQNWKSMIDQGSIRRMPSYISVKGQRVQTRRPDGSMLRAHEECANRMLRYMESKGQTTGPAKPKRKHIIEAGE